MIELTQSTLEAVRLIAEEAGKAILKIYQLDNYEIQTKSDDTPLTKADLASHNIIFNALSKLAPEIPILCEEGEKLNIDVSTFWCVDPLDGTKEFINKSDEFTVNLALINNHKPVFGFVGIPALDTLYWGGKGHDSFKSSNNTSFQAIHVKKTSNVTRVFASKSHLNPETETFIDALVGEIELVQAGSSLKFLRIAEGEADIYPRLAPTCEWDTAAAHAVLEGAGGSVTQVDGSELRYGKTNILNPYFVARGKV